MKLSRWRAQSNNFAGSVVGGGGVAHGPTVQIAGVTTPLSLVHGTTGTFTATPEDINDVSTGTAKYWHSSDAAVVRIDDATTGAYTVTGVATNTVTITVNFVAPAGEPAYTAATGQTVIINTDLTESEYASAAVSGAFPYASGDNIGPTRFMPLNSPALQGRPVDPAVNEIIADSGTKWLRNKWTGAATASAAWQLWPVQPQTAVRTYGCSFTQRWNLTTGLPQVKNFEAHGQAVNPDDNGRLQVSSVPGGPGGAQMWWQVHDMGYPVNLGEVNGPFGSGLQDVADGLEHSITAYWRWHDRSPGTVDRLVYQINPLPFTTDTFTQSQTGVLANGNRVKLRNSGGTADASTAEFIVSNFDGDKRATLTRASDILGSTVAYSGGIWFLAVVTYHGVFSASQAGHLSNGDVLSMNFAQGMPPCRVVAFDGAFGCELPQDNPPEENLPIQDSGGLWFSRPSDQTGFLQYWVDHRKVIDLSAATLGVTPPGGSQPWTTAAALATLAVGASLSYPRFGDVQANSSGPWTMDVGRRITLWWEP